MVDGSVCGVKRIDKGDLVSYFVPFMGHGSLKYRYDCSSLSNMRFDIQFCWQPSHRHNHNDRRPDGPTPETTREITHGIKMTMKITLEEWNSAAHYVLHVVPEMIQTGKITAAVDGVISPRMILPMSPISITNHLP